VLLVWGVNMVSLLNKRHQNWSIHLEQMVDGISEWANKDLHVLLVLGVNLGSLLA
jgi:hypothetical protein